MDSPSENNFASASRVKESKNRVMLLLSMRFKLIGYSLKPRPVQ